MEASMSDNDYNLLALWEAYGEDTIEDIELVVAMSDPTSKEQKINWDHTPTKNKSKKNDATGVWM